MLLGCVSRVPSQAAAWCLGSRIWMQLPCQHLPCCQCFPAHQLFLILFFFNFFFRSLVDTVYALKDEVKELKQVIWMGLFVLGVEWKPTSLCWVIFSWSVPGKSLADPGPILQIPEWALVFFWFTSLNHRIIESLRLEKTGEIMESNRQPRTTAMFTTKACPGVPYPHILWTLPGMVTPPLPSADCSSVWQRFPWRNFS